MNNSYKHRVPEDTAGQVSGCCMVDNLEFKIESLNHWEPDKSIDNMNSSRE